MRSFKFGYLVGSLATASINRLLAKALVRVAPPELHMTEIPFKDLPLYFMGDGSQSRRRLRPVAAKERAAGSLVVLAAPCGTRP